MAFNEDTAPPAVQYITHVHQHFEASPDTDRMLRELVRRVRTLTTLGEMDMASAQETLDEIRANRDVLASMETLLESNTQRLEDVSEQLRQNGVDTTLLDQVVAEARSQRSEAIAAIAANTVVANQAPPVVDPNPDTNADADPNEDPTGVSEPTTGNSGGDTGPADPNPPVVDPNPDTNADPDPNPDPNATGAQPESDTGEVETNSPDPGDNPDVTTPADETTTGDPA